MASINCCTLSGIIGKEPEERSTSDFSITRFSLAVKQSKKEAPTMWLDVTAFGKLAKFVLDYMHKGDRVAVVGRLEYREWTDEKGAKHTAYGVTANDVISIGSGSSQERPQERAKSETPRSYGRRETVNRPKETSSDIMGDEDLPF